MMQNKELYTKKQRELMSYLFKVRGATARQILYGIKGVENTHYKSTELKRINEMLQRLHKRNIVTSFLPSYHTGHIHYLTEDGLSDMRDFLNIPINHIGTGLNDDYGYFTHNVYSPPKKAIAHFLMQTDIQNIVFNINKAIPGYIAYRDNLYSVRSFKQTADDKKLTEVKLRPDGEIRIGDDIYFIEVDRSTERTEELTMKFQRYNQYLDYLKKEGLSAPKGVIFVKENRPNEHSRRLVYGFEKRRYANIRSIFSRNCKNHLSDFDFIYCEIGKLKALLETMNAEHRSKTTLKAVNMAKSIYKEDNNFGYQNLDNFKLLLRKTSDSDQQLYIFGTVEGYESAAWTKAISFYKQITKQIPNTYFIACYSTAHCIPAYSPNELSLLSDKKERDFYSNLFILNTAGTEPLWFDAYHNLLESSPLQITN
ncbi:replication-relaxation family protein [Rummeliibacillus stabekisii]|uniref:replication-relaxation family protein n=1 Tax=Rummeliibacillus stabekisii TaxID=241244 RepID=UPI003723515C